MWTCANENDIWAKMCMIHDIAFACSLFTITIYRCDSIRAYAIDLCRLEERTIITMLIVWMIVLIGRPILWLLAAHLACKRMQRSVISELHNFCLFLRNDSKFTNPNDASHRKKFESCFWEVSIHFKRESGAQICRSKHGTLATTKGESHKHTNRSEKHKHNKLTKLAFYLHFDGL